MKHLITEKDLESVLHATAYELGYGPACDPFRGERSDVSWTFSRTDGAFTYEIISCLVRIHPIEAVVHFIGSEYSADELQLQDAFASTVMVSLFDFQFYKLQISASDLLPKVITVGNDTSVLTRLSAEVRRTDRVVWADLVRRAARRGGT